VLIDWFTVIAQIINFLILVLLLKRFLYKPILAAMDSRQQQIDSNLYAAEEQKLLAEQERSDLLNRSAELERGKAEQLKLATEEAETLRKGLTEQARSEIATQRRSWTASLNRDREAVCSALTHRAQDELIATLRAALTDMASAELEGEMAARFIRCLHEMDASEKSTLKSQLGSAKPPVVIKSCFEMSSAARTKVESAVRTDLGVTCPVEFQQTPNLICGVELAADGHKISWTMAQYLTTLHDNVETAMAEQKPSDKGHPDDES
jgi:F-type H+-transporting ATPase subunit b